ncbi:hypothetical protein SY88_05210 [Clostridiales bacterium PH28_bin88]|nr:hypothetical protein SY88_05210 [Clostridiales bacterium PH28_bin88]
MSVTSLSTKGQVVIPKEIREALRLKPGNKLNVRLEGRSIVIEPAKPNLGARLYGRYRGVNLLKEIEEEHKRDLLREDPR